MKFALGTGACEVPQEEESDWVISPASPTDDWSAQRQPQYTSVSRLERQQQIELLDSFVRLAPGWDSYNAEPPGEVAIANARRVLHCSWCSDTIGAPRLAPSVEGGVGIIFSSHGKRYADIECFNDGEILAITSEPGSEPSVWSLGNEPGSVRKAIERIGLFLNG